MKLTHLEHIEDTIFDGNFIQAYDTIDALVDAVCGDKIRGLSLSTKYDGAPSIVFGYNPDNGRKFVGTKSVFNKRNPKIAYTHADIDGHYGSIPDLAAKLKLVAESFNHLPRGVWQGDFMWSHDDLKVNDKQVMFTPNTITYHVDSSHQDAEDIYHSEMGIVLHTAYEGDTMAELSARLITSQEISHFRCKANDAYIIDPTFDIGVLGQVTTGRIELLNKHIEVLDSLDNSNVARVALGKVKHHSEMLKMFINYCIRMGESNPSADMYRVFLINRNENELAAEIKVGSPFDLVLAIHQRFCQIKSILLDILFGNQKFYTEVNDKPVKGEGFVVSYYGIPYKLVDRMEFSRSNFMNKRFAKA